ncbi:hypothetical protein ABW286_17190 [Erwinia papayae]|uniref:DUF4304 domain-containing protein n=1 Tax=Erwinia papayae TaxID=206499 RepID=A0ABV3N520_9GAMM
MNSKRKIGESQVIDFFSAVLRDKFSDRYKKNKPISIGNFSGSQDRKFADFFAGTASSNILIEFKEFESDYTKEWDKPLRQTLCRIIDADTAQFSRRCHFIAWRESDPEVQVSIAPYIDKVCPQYNTIPPLQAFDNIPHKDFINDFLDDEKGITPEEFKDYVKYMDDIAGGKQAGENVPFKSILYSYQDEEMVATYFKNLGELRSLITQLFPERKMKRKI